METDLSSFSNSSKDKILCWSVNLKAHVDCLSGYLILFCGKSTLNSKNWTEKLQKLLIKCVFYQYSCVEHIEQGHVVFDYLFSHNLFTCFSNIKLLPIVNPRNFSRELLSLETFLSILSKNLIEINGI